MKPIIDPVDRGLLKAELTEERHLRKTNRAGNELYVVGPEAVNVIREIGRLREIAFRNDGGGTGEPLDIDKFDTDPAYGYKQLVLWDPDAEEIIGGYRFCRCDEAVYDRFGQPILTSSHMFKFSRKFLRDYLPYTLELGRSFVSVDYQSSKAGSKSIYALDNLFDGIAALMVLYKDSMKYLFGKMTIYPLYNHVARDLILRFLSKHFHDPDELVSPYHPIGFETDPVLANLILCESDLRKDYRRLKEAVRNLGTNIPPLVNSYINLSSTMKCFGSTVNDELGNAIETGIMICFNEMYEDKRERHIEAFLRKRLEDIREKHPRFYASAAEKLREHMEKRRLKFFQKFQRELRPQEQSPEVEFL